MKTEDQGSPGILLGTAETFSLILNETAIVGLHGQHSVRQSNNSVCACVRARACARARVQSRISVP